MARLTPDEALRRVEEWRGASVRWEELGGGITNHNYLVRVAGGLTHEAATYVLRIPGMGTDRFIDRAVERACMVEAARVGVAPRVAYQIEPEGALVIEFVDGEIMHPDTMAGHPARIGQAVATVRDLHDRATFGHHIDVFRMLDHYVDVARQLDAPMPTMLRAMLRATREIERAAVRHPVPPAACHNDLLSENFIVDRDDRMWVIDWEYGGMADPYFDLGDFVMEHPFSHEQEREVIETYCGRPDDARLARMMLYKAVSAVWWAVWAMIQHTVSEIDFDYMGWGAERIARAEAVTSDDDYSSWLAEA